MRFETLLIANRGEIAVRIARTARDMGLRTVGVFSEADAGALHVDACDLAVALPGSSPGETYLDIDAIVDAARRTGAGAVHPGYGFLSEHAGFARACADAGLVVVGPSPETIEAMGSKTRAKTLMAAAGVPVLPGATVGDHVDAAEVLAVGDLVGFPLLVKAVFGGGGRGMRLVTDRAHLLEAVADAQHEAASAFTDGSVFLEQFVESPRHIEVQILGDHQGHLVDLGERECSIQRRHQKIIEEAPSPFVDPLLRRRLGDAARRAGAALGYVGAGTVEFVVAPDGSFAFLEVNTRLQVEHPVTEAVTGLDLVRLQLEIASGRPLPAALGHVETRGHAIEARLYAEDVLAGYLPSTGALSRFEVPERGGIRVDTGYANGSTVGPHYDAMLAKVISWAPTRDEAAAALAATLASARIHGVTTNRDLLVGILAHPAFVAGHTDTGFLDRHDPGDLAASAQARDARAVHAIVAAVAGAAARRSRQRRLSTLPSGWRNVSTQNQRVDFVGDGPIEYGFREGRYQVGDVGLDVEVVDVQPDRVEVELDGVRVVALVDAREPVIYVDSPLGSTAHVEVERFPLPERGVARGSLEAPMPGIITELRVRLGDAVEAGDVLVVMEAMKMQHQLRAPEGGVVTEVLVEVGGQVEAGAPIVVVVPADA